MARILDQTQIYMCASPILAHIFISDIAYANKLLQKSILYGTIFINISMGTKPSMDKETKTHNEQLKHWHSKGVRIQIYYVLEQIIAYILLVVASNGIWNLEAKQNQKWWTRPEATFYPSYFNWIKKHTDKDMYEWCDVLCYFLNLFLVSLLHFLLSTMTLFNF